MLLKPTLILKESRCRKNIQMMVAKARNAGVDFRPHFKTHVSRQIGAWFKDEGVGKITVSSVSMAKYFSEDWKDITIAFPVNILEIDQINDLARNLHLNLLVESIDTIVFLKQNILYPISCFIKIDIGYHRTGILPDNTELIDGILKHIESSTLIHFAGFLCHAGQSYKCTSKNEILDVHNDSKKTMIAIKTKYSEKYPYLKTSLGDTPTCSIAKDFSGIDEIRPGNFVFYDLMQEQLGACNNDQIAVALACPVVAIHPERNEIVIYGGGVHFSKESLLHPDYGTIYGQVVESNSIQWGEAIKGMYVKSLSQEHGVIHVPSEIIQKYKIGDLMYILPVHSCMTADTMGEYYTTENVFISRM